MDLNARKPIFGVQNAPSYDSNKPVQLWRLVRQNKKISVFRENFCVLQVRILGRVCAHIYYFLEKKYVFMHFERHFAFQNA